ncbi:MAG: hypothetical protein GDA52_01860 [Rhodobacteraceae bacterium]|nr:hypothetical protein [Paracoccaceae bacterium]
MIIFRGDDVPDSFDDLTFTRTDREGNIKPNYNVITGTKRKDNLVGTKGQDLINGGRKDDVLTGGTAKDRFVFDYGHGNDTITDFEDGVDLLEFTPHWPVFGSFTITGGNGDAKIEWDGGSILLKGVDHTDLTAEDFILDAPRRPLSESEKYPNTLITWGDEENSIYLQKVGYAVPVLPDDLSAENFIFEGADDDVGAVGKVNELEGTDASDTLTGSSGRDSVDGGAGNDKLIGRADNDVINGGVGRDTLVGNRGDDTLDGGRYSDTLIGGHGDDVLAGGKWKDTFAFDTGHENDVITDFEDGMDMINITASDVGFDDLTIADKGSDTVVTWDGGSITLEGVDHTALTVEDFIFG